MFVCMFSIWCVCDGVPKSVWGMRVSIGYGNFACLNQQSEIASEVCECVRVYVGGVSFRPLCVCAMVRQVRSGMQSSDLNCTHPMALRGVSLCVFGRNNVVVVI